MVEYVHPVLTPYKFADFELTNRTVVSALTRTRADPVLGLATDLHVEYYSARANAGFILTECMAISADSNAFPGSANLFNDDQATAWKKVVDAVHAKGGRIFA